MTTVEDVFYLYERNSLFYSNCLCLDKFEQCPTKWTNECYCFMGVDVNPITIGDTNLRCRLNTKCYIKPGEECPICYESINTKTNAFLTSCGHSFHRKCLFKVYENKCKKSVFTNFRCPMCRTVISNYLFHDKYNIKKNMNTLDYLENFWITKDYEVPTYCSNKYNHYLGMNNSCKKCKFYRMKGQ
jgi:Ring finger domain